jgi:two-component system, response regulator, stage 0 sporulation protein F
MQDILIVDDQPYILDLFASELGGCNTTLITAENIEEAWTYLETFKVDLVILDLYVNGGYSWDLLEKIKNNYKELPVLIVTAYDSFMDDPRALKADAYLVKNLQNIDLIGRKVRDLLN